MTAHAQAAATAAAARLTGLRNGAPTRAGTGGPSDDERTKLLEQLAGWTLTVLLAVLVTRLGLM